MKKISINNYKSSGSRIFSGRERGSRARGELQLDILDRKEDKVIVLIPRGTWAINSSFFGGLFEKSVIDLGEEGFRSKYNFVMDDDSKVPSDIMRNIDCGIFDALNEI